MDETKTIRVMERWDANGNGWIKIGDQDWQPMDNLYWHGKTPYVRLPEPSGENS